jgi:hypothetical protein
MRSPEFGYQRYIASSKIIILAAISERSWLDWRPTDIIAALPHATHAVILGRFRNLAFWFRLTAKCEG